MQTLAESNDYTHTNTRCALWNKKYYRVLNLNWHLPYALIQNYSCITNDAYTEFLTAIYLFEVTFESPAETVLSLETQYMAIHVKSRVRNWHKWKMATAQKH